MTTIKKMLSRECFLFYTLFYLLFKYTFFNQGKFLTYFMFGYALIIFLYDLYKNRGIYKFNGYVFSYLMCGSAALSCIIVAHRIDLEAIKGISILFINFFMYLPIFHGKNISYIKRTYKVVFIAILVYSFIVNLIGTIFASFGISITFFGTQFGAVYGGRLVTVRETANETAWFAIFSLVISLYLLIKNYTKSVKLDNKIKFFLIVNLIIQMITYYLSGNRSSIIGLGVFFIVFIFSLSKYLDNKKYKYISITLFLTLIVALVIYLYFKINDPSTSDAARYDMIVYGILYLTTVNPFFGSSYVNLISDLENNFETVWGKFNFKSAKSYIASLTKSGNAHNVFIQQIETNGLIGLTVLISFFIFIFKELFRVINSITKYDEDFAEKMLIVYFVVFGFVVGNISWNIIGTMTCFVNLMFFLSISAILSINEK